MNSEWDNAEFFTVDTTYKLTFTDDEKRAEPEFWKSLKDNAPFSFLNQIEKQSPKPKIKAVPLSGQDTTPVSTACIVSY
jgi:hypothetical protein